MELSPRMIATIVEHALQEDIGQGDRTTLAVIPPDMRVESHIVARCAGVVAGLPVMMAVFDAIDSTVNIMAHVTEGGHVHDGGVVARIAGKARSILTAERVALNFLQRLSGIATLTAHYVAAVSPLPVGILDTRKTTPGLRAFEKYAVTVGGGLNHRFGLYDAVMLKDNHLMLLSARGISLHEAVRLARTATGPLVAIEIEAESAEQAAMAADAGANMILLDNMSLDELRKSVAVVQGRAKLEASGGITLDTVRAVAETGIDYISVGALTHSYHALDMSLDILA